MGGGNGVEEGGVDVHANMNDWFIRCGLSCFVSEEITSTAITRKPKSPSLISEINRGPST